MRKAKEFDDKKIDGKKTENEHGQTPTLHQSTR